jgi:pyruvate dehydrogenase complex dehydrogenase (E1) component
MIKTSSNIYIYIYIHIEIPQQRYKNLLNNKNIPRGIYKKAKNTTQQPHYGKLFLETGSVLVQSTKSFKLLTPNKLILT